MTCYSWLNEHTAFTDQDHANCRYLYIDDSGVRLSWIKTDYPETHINAHGVYVYPIYTVEFTKRFEGK